MEFTLTPPSRLPTLRLDRSASTDLSADFALPDYLPEIKRLLRVTPAVLPDSRYLSANSAEFSGTVEYLVTYSGADGGLWSTRLRQDYSTSTPIDADQLAQGLDPHADTQVESVVSRVTGPRKLSIRTRLRTHFTAWDDESIEPQLDGNPPASVIERLTKTQRTSRILRAQSEPIDLGDEIMLNSTAGELRVIRADACVNLTDVAAVADGIACRGEVILQLLTCTEQDGETMPPELITRKLPLAEQLILSDAAPGMPVRAWGYCSDIEVRFEDDRICCDVTAWIEAEAHQEMDLAMTEDLYATTGTLEDITTREIETTQLMKCANVNFTVSENLPLKGSGIDPAAEIVDLAAVLQAEAVDTSENRCALNGTCRLSVIYRLDGEYCVNEAALPFRQMLDCTSVDAPELTANLTVCAIRVHAEGEKDARNLQVELDVCGAICLRASGQQRIVQRAVYHPETSKETPACIICYPDASDTLWSICKRYQVSRGKVTTANHLQSNDACDKPSSLAGVAYLLI